MALDGVLIGIGVFTIAMALVKPDALIAYPGGTRARRIGGLIGGTVIAVAGLVLVLLE